MSKDGRILYVMPHSHIDVEWYWTIETTREWTRDILRRALDLLRRDPEYRFTQDQTVLLEGFWGELGPEERAFLLRMVHEGRFAIVGGTYVQPEVDEPGGESLIRQIIRGQQWLMATWGIRARCGWFIDTFGQVPQMPQILARAGYRYNVFWRDIPPHVGLENMPADFFWEAPDGSRLLTHWLPGGYTDDPEQTELALAQSNTRHVLLPLGGDVVRPSADSAGIRRGLQSTLGELGAGEAEVCLATALNHLDAVSAEAKDLPVLSYDMNPSFFSQDLRGTYDNRAELKLRSRAVERALYSAEAVAAVASTAGHPYPRAALARQWERLLFSQFHDTMGGSICDPVYLAAMERLGAVLSELEPLTAEALRGAVPGAGEPGDLAVIYNTLSFPRRELCRLAAPAGLAAGAVEVAVEDRAGHRLPARLAEDGAIEFVAEVPATGYEAYRLVVGTGAPACLRASGPSWVENAWFRVAWDLTTCDLVSIWDKAHEREVLWAPGNTILAAREQDPDLEGDIHLTGEVASSSRYRARSIAVGEDALGIRVLAESDYADCSLLREVTLYDHAPRLDFRTTLRDFRGGDVLVKACFPLRIDWRRAERVYETPFAATPRPDGHYCAQTWVDCSDGRYGAVLLNHGTPGYWIQDGRLELVLLRSLADYRGYQMMALPKGLPGYESSTQAELAREHGTHVFRYSLHPHAGGWLEADPFRLGQSLNTPLLALPGLGQGVVQSAGQSLISCEPDLAMTALKRSEDDQSLVLRGFETRGQAHTVAVHLPPFVRWVAKASLLEEPAEELPIAERAVAFSCAPHEIVTLLLRPAER